MRKTRYVIVFNLSGLHNTVYECHPHDGWWDNEGDIEGVEKHLEGCHHFIFSSKAEARKALRVLQTYIGDLKARL